jgi:hypothetical protein
MTGLKLKSLIQLIRFGSYLRSRKELTYRVGAPRTFVTLYSLLTGMDPIETVYHSGAAL